jgi:FkbM family methyltransferase
LDTKDISLTPHILLDGVWEINVTKAVLRILAREMNVIEVGANVGYYSTLIGSRVNRLFCFEANKKMYDLLKKNVEINGLIDKVVCVNKAVTNKQGIVRLNLFRDHMGSSTICKVENETLSRYNESIQEVEIESISIDEYFKGLEMPIHLIKIDAEGSEPLIIEGMKRILETNRNLILVMELNVPMISSYIDVKKFLQNLQSLGFELNYVDSDSTIKQASVEELVHIGQCDMYLTRTQ